MRSCEMIARSCSTTEDQLHFSNWMGGAIQLARKCHERAREGMSRICCDEGAGTSREAANPLTAGPVRRRGTLSVTEQHCFRIHVAKGQHSCTSCVFSLSLSLRPHAGLGTRRWHRFAIGGLCCYPPSVPSSVLHASQDCELLMPSACIPSFSLSSSAAHARDVCSDFLSVRAPLMPKLNWNIISNHGPVTRRPETT